MNKSAEIRRLYAEGRTLAGIAKELGVRYQYVWNVINRMKEQQESPLRQSDSIGGTPAVPTRNWAEARAILQKLPDHASYQLYSSLVDKEFAEDVLFEYLSSDDIAGLIMASHDNEAAPLVVCIKEFDGQRATNFFLSMSPEVLARLVRSLRLDYLDWMLTPLRSADGLEKVIEQVESVDAAVAAWIDRLCRLY